MSRTPLRISFVGGGSDLKSFYRTEPGSVVSTAIAKYIYITVNQKFDGMIRASYSVTEIVDHPGKLQNELIRETLQLLGVEHGIEITSISDIPSQGTGLGSSSSYTVGLLHALHAYLGRYPGAERLAREACAVEIERCGQPIGKQDQYIAAFGGFQHIQFNPDETVFVDPIMCPHETKRRLQDRLLMLYTGITRPSRTVLGEQSANVERSREALRHLTCLVADFRAALQTGDLDAVGEILHAGWMIKRQLATLVTNNRIDGWYERARRSGAIGGKLLGAGGGGFLLLCAPREDHPKILASLPELHPVPFRFEQQGSKIIYVEEQHAED